MGKSTNDTEANLSIIAEDVDVPDSEDESEKLLQDVEAAVKEVLTEYGLEPSFLLVNDGHVYSQIKDTCPQCNKHIKLLEPELCSEGRATAHASCDCGWYGRAIYRLIDYHEDVSDQDINMDKYLFDQASCVRLYGIDPLYTRY